MGVQFPRYGREDGEMTITGYEGTYEFFRFEGLCPQRRDCVPKLKLFDCICDTWGRTYKTWEQYEGDDCTEDEKHLAERANYFKFGEYNIFEVKDKSHPVDHSNGVNYFWNMEGQCYKQDMGDKCWYAWKRITRNVDVAKKAGLEYRAAKNKKE